FERRHPSCNLSPMGVASERCPNCGGPMESSADGRSLGCDYCGHPQVTPIDPARLAAGLRADHQSAEQLFEHLAIRLVELVPERATVEARGGLLAKRRAHELVVTLERAVYRMRRESRSIVAERATTVRGITL